MATTAKTAPIKRTVKRKVAEAQDTLEQSVSSLRDILSNKDFDNIPEVAQLRERLDAGLSEIETSAHDIVVKAKRKTKKAARATNELVHNEPWPVLGAAVVLGAVIGFVAGRR